MEEVKVGLNQTIARKMNNLLAINEIKKKPLSGTELSEILSLSNATASSIIKSLLSIGLIRIESSESAFGLGRKRLKYTINEKYGLIVVISFSNLRLHVVVSDINANTLYESESEVEEYNYTLIKNAVDGVNDVLERNQFKDIPLRAVIISLPGLINQKTGELQVGPQFNQDLFASSDLIKSYPAKVFKCPVYLENDSKLMMLAELERGEFDGVQTGMLAYIDYGIGGAIEFDGKLYFGSRGYCGEIGRLRIDIDNSNPHLDDVASLRVIKKELLEKRNKKYKTNEIVKAFYEKDELVQSLVLRSAKAVGLVIKEVIRVFDIEQFTIAGRVSKFGDLYLESVKKETFNDNQDAIIRFSSLDSDPIIEGAKAMGASQIIKNALESL